MQFSEILKHNHLPRQARHSTTESSKKKKRMCCSQHSDGVADPSGYIPHTAPTIAGGGGPAWSGFVIVMPWEVYLRSGDEVTKTTFPILSMQFAYLISEGAQP